LVAQREYLFHDLANERIQRLRISSADNPEEISSLFIPRQKTLCRIEDLVVALADEGRISGFPG
jgi:hypothetical protein